MQEQVSHGDVLLPIGREPFSQQGGITHLHIYAQWRLNVTRLTTKIKDLFLLLVFQDREDQAGMSGGQKVLQTCMPHTNNLKSCSQIKLKPNYKSEH